MKKVFALLLSVMMLMFMTGCVAEEPTELGLSAPWITFEKEMEVLFDQDPQVQIVFDQEKMELRVYVMKDQEKAAALDALLPDTKEFGNITLKITVIPPNPTGISNAELFEKAFKGNPALSFIHVAESPFGNFTYIVFQNKVVQFFNDNVQDIYGNTSTLYQEIAKDVFDADRVVFYCTEAPEELKKPLGEWP